MRTLSVVRLLPANWVLILASVCSDDPTYRIVVMASVNHEALFGWFHRYVIELRR